jgi:glutathione S-transferase
MAILTLYHAPSSYYSMIARWALLEAGLSFDSHRLDIHRTQQQLSDAYLAINPMMTVPALSTGTTVLTDSADILAYAALHAGQHWQPGSPESRRIVAAHYAIPIERLTFSKAMSSLPPLRLLFPHLLRSMCRDLSRRMAADPAQRSALQAKLRLNESRIAYFKDGSLSLKLEAERQHVRDFLAQLPAPLADGFLLGDRIGEADIVTAVLLGRLRMISEWPLAKDRPDLARWFDRIAARPAFSQADIWTRLQLRRILFQQSDRLSP